MICHPTCPTVRPMPKMLIRRPGGDSASADNETDATLSMEGADAEYFDFTDAGALTVSLDFRAAAATDVNESHTPEL